MALLLAHAQGTDGLPGSLCSITGGPVAGYNLTACSAQMSLRCSPPKSGRLVGSGIGFCNFTTPGQQVSPHMASHGPEPHTQHYPALTALLQGTIISHKE